MGTRRVVGVAAVLLVALVAGGLVLERGLGGTDRAAVLDPRAEPLAVAAPVPTYTLGAERGLLVRSGGAGRVLPDGVEGRWLPGGALLVVAEDRRRLRLVDPSSGEVLAEAPVGLADLPGRSAGRVNLLARYGRPSVLRSWSADLGAAEKVVLPETDDPAAEDDPDITRNYFGVAATVGDATFVLWHDSSETYDDGDRGVARIRDGEVDTVLRGEPLVALYLSVDGASLLALRQVRGEPCGGCVVEQEVVEIDPVEGTLRSYGHPDEYDESWRVDAIDRVGDRVAVRYVRTGDGRVPRERNLLGTYVYADGDWSLLPGSDEATTWWQDGGRVIARPAREPLRGADGYRISWVRDGSDRERPVEGELVTTYGRFGARFGSVAGQLLPPGD
ncbi:hypothetical protein QWY28_14640 [Nocardioides sp. SOB77]|uniref:Uncharacterized protein n=1 Tax=Nocardioides oceani TaxID=3058369 RepID=A0ABT8FHN3_9ACTN|nr:hypothetical protein [Nocardioides oceani]MDN4174198.1 hypothetical protein [Nocardioides oceani]